MKSNSQLSTVNYQLPKGWEIKKLKDIGDIFNGNSINAKVKKEKYSHLADGLPYIATKDISFESKIDYENGIKIPYEEKASFKVAKKNTILICAEGGSAGRKIGFTEQNVCFGNKLFALSTKVNIVSRFVYYYYFSAIFQKDFTKQLTGIIGGVSMGKFKQIQIPIPPLPEQKRIVAILDRAFEAIDKAKANAEQNLKNAKELFENYLQDVLSDKKWKIVKLGDVCNKVEYGSSSKSKEEGEIPVLRMGNIQNGRFTWDNLKYSDNKEDNEKYLLKYNDVLFNRTNSPELVGKTAIYKGERPAIFAGYLIRVYRKKDLLDADYLNYYLNSRIAKEYGNTVVISSVNQANINGTKLKTYPIPLPSLKEQQQIVEELDKLTEETKKIEAIYQKKIEDLEELKKSVLQKAFSGQLTIDNGQLIMDNR